jgi:predicted nuclease of restriction endonuclease-like (RecB) superfamily
MRTYFELFLIRNTQRQIIVDGRYHMVDIVLYHRGIPAIIVVDLKVGQKARRPGGAADRIAGLPERRR